MQLDLDHLYMRASERKTHFDAFECLNLHALRARINFWSTYLKSFHSLGRTESCVVFPSARFNGSIFIKLCCSDVLFRLMKYSCVQRPNYSRQPGAREMMDLMIAILSPSPDFWSPTLIEAAGNNFLIFSSAPIHCRRHIYIYQVSSQKLWIIRRGVS